MKDLTKWWPALLAGLLLVVFAFALRDEAPPAAPATVSYSEFKQLLRDGEVSQLLLAEQRAVATLKPAGEDGAGTRRVQANLPPLDDAELMPLIEASGAVVTVEGTAVSAMELGGVPETVIASCTVPLAAPVAVPCSTTL